MNNEKKIVITVYGNNDGQNKIIDRISLGIFDEANAKAYCHNMNSLVLQDAWIFSRIVSENIGYPLDESLLLKFDCILGLDNSAIKNVLREVDSQELAQALKGADEKIQARIFENMSKRAAGILQEDMEYMGPILINDVMDKQEKILDIIRRLERTGEIVSPNVKEENAAGIAADKSDGNGSDADEFNDSPIHLVHQDELDDDELGIGELGEDGLDYEEYVEEEIDEEKNSLNCGNTLTEAYEYCTHCGKYVSTEGFSPEAGLTRFLDPNFLDREIEIFGERFKLNISKSEFYKRRALAYQLQDQYGEAIADYTWALELEPENINLYGLRAELYMQNGQYSEAIAGYTRVIANSAGKIDDYYLLRRAEAYKEMGEFDKAIADSGKALEISPDDSDTWEFRAKIYEAAGEYQKAIRDCQKALEIDPDAFFAKKILARCWEKVNLKSDGNNNMASEVKYTTMQAALAAVKENGRELEYVPEELKTAELCLAALQRHPDMAREIMGYVPESLQERVKAAAGID